MSCENVTAWPLFPAAAHPVSTLNLFIKTKNSTSVTTVKALGLQLVQEKHLSSLKHCYLLLLAASFY